IQDITATKQIEEEYERFFALSLDLLCIASFDGYFKRLSSAWERTLGFSQQELCAAPFLSFVHPDDEAATRIVWQKLADGQAIQGFENRFRCKDGGYRWLSWSATVLPHQQRLYAIARDITTQKTMLARLSYETHYDTLTGLPNRTFILEQLLQMAVPTAGSGFRLCAVLFVDLDSFKMINNGMGHVIGDQVLIAVSRRLKASLPPNSILTRFGADEFVILLPVLDTHMEALAVAERVHQCLQQPVLLEGWEIFLSASIGVAFNAPDMQHPNELLRNADTALHRAKMQGKRCTEIFDLLMHQQVTAQLQIANELQYILSRQELVLHYQPIVNLATGQIAGFEALVRWQHPRRGLLHPDAFLDVADEMGLVVALDYWVLRTACRQVRQWQQQLAAHSRLAINVNLSAKACNIRHFWPSLMQSWKRQVSIVAVCTSNSQKGHCSHPANGYSRCLRHSTLGRCMYTWTTLARAIRR
ncbi:MAG: diguanylate cyclase, partial [Chloroflexaceae bacterium]|nr:diguanylate cyclase [Chloroflexaceae bacterium]